MPRQQTRSSGEGAIDPSLVQKKRARHRLVGALCVCLIAAVVVPLVLESEPRPHRDVPMELASAVQKAGSQAATGPAAATADAAAQADPTVTGKGATASGSIGASGNASSGRPAEADAQPAPSQSAVRTITPPALAERVVPGSRAEVKPDAKPPVRSDPKPDAKVESRPPAAVAPKAEAKPPKSEPKASAKVEPKGDARTDLPSESAQAPARSGEPDVLAKLIDRANNPGSAKSAAGGNDSATRTNRKFLVQIGAFSNVQSARNVSDRAVQAGLRPYQETVKTAQGDWIRVRVGPFTTRQDAERAQQDLKRAGVTAAIIAL